jgi:hypothetical protein
MEATAGDMATSSGTEDPELGELLTAGARTGAAVTNA